MPHFARVIDILTLERARFYAVLTMAAVFAFVIYDFRNNPESLTASIDFPAFYNAGRILNSYPWEKLYDRDIQERLYIALVPGTSPGDPAILFFPYSPFFALLFAPIALLPYKLALPCWSIISFILFTVGFSRIWKTSGLPSKAKLSAFLIAVSFLPFNAWCLLIGQSSAFGFFALALAISWDWEGKSILSGLALSLLLYKPPLLILFLPMLLITGRLKTFAAFCAGGIALVSISLAMIGSSGLPAYLEMLRTFSVLKITGRRRTFHEIDIFSFLLSVFHHHIWLTLVVTLVISVLVFALLARAWVRRPDRAWALAIPWTIILNLYFLIYDSTILILAVLLTVAWVGKPRALRWLIAALFVTALFDLARLSFQPLTFAIAAFGCYQLRANQTDH